MTIDLDKQLDAKARRLAKKAGYRIHKSRTRNTYFNDMGGYMLLTSGNCVEEGWRHELTAQDVIDICLLGF